MKKAIFTVAAMGCAFSSQAAVFHYASFMTAGQEVHLPASDAFGSSGFSIDTTTGRLFGSFTAVNLENGPGSVTDYHMHLGNFGVAGPVRLWNNQPGNIVQTTTSTWVVSFDLLLTQRSGSTGVLFDFDGDNSGGIDSDDVNTLIGHLNAQGMYTNVHTTFSAPGEIRGQIVRAPVPEPATVAALGLGALALIRRRRK